MVLPLGKIVEFAPVEYKMEKKDQNMLKLKKAFAMLLCVAMLMTLCMTMGVAAETASAPAAATKTAPTDVVTDTWCREAVTFVWDKGYMSGYSDGSFRPDAVVTRGQLFQTLYKLQGMPKVPEKASFADIPADAWYAQAAAWAEDKGLTTGTAAGFAADASIDRQQLAKVLCAYAELTGRTLRGGDIAAFTDANQIAEYAKSAVKSAVGSGLMNGYGTTFRPTATLNRGQLAQVITNFFALDVSYDSAKRPLLLQGAMDIETTTMIEALKNPTAYRLGQWDYVAGTLNGYPTVVSRTEQGMSNAGASTALAMEFFNPIAVINQGTSGGHDPALHTFDIVLGTQSVNYSAWKSTPSAKGAGVDYTALEQNGVYAYDKAKKTFEKSVFYPGDTTLLAAANAVKASYTEGKVSEGVISSCDAWNNQIDRMLFLHQFYGSSCEEMETNAVAQLCKTYDVPFLGIRILSNTGIYNESFNWKTGAACQNYVLAVAKQYIDTTLKTASNAVTENKKTEKATYDKTLQPILLEGAIDIETTTMTQALKDPVAYKLGQWDYVAGTLDGYPAVVCRTEKGLANAGASTALAMEFFNPIAVVNQGTAGGHDPALHTFDIVIGDRTVNLTAWKTVPSAKGAGVDYKAFEMNGVYSYDLAADKFTQFVYDPGDADLLAAANASKKSYVAGKIVNGTIGSSEAWNNQIDQILYLHEFVGTSCEEMETNSVAQICRTYDVPFLGVRALSNTGIYNESFNWKTGAACQNYVLSVAQQYIASNLK